MTFADQNHGERRQGEFHAETTIDQELESTVITLQYRDPEDSARNRTVRVAPNLGSNMFELSAGEHEIIYCERDLLKRKDFTGNFVLWPIPNRVRNKRYEYQGQSYSLAEVKRRQGNDVLIHGLVLDRQWNYGQPIEEADAISVQTFVEITPESPFYANYPFDSRLTLTYTLRANGVTVTYDVHNTGTKQMPFGFALHPYFRRLSGDDETFVSIPAARVMEADDELLPTGRVLDITGIMYSMFDLRAPVALSHLKLDHVYTAIEQGKNARIEYRKQNLNVQLITSEDFTHSVIFTAPGLDVPFFCLENQTCASDAINLHNQGLKEISHLLELPPGEHWQGFIEFRIE